MIRLLFMMLCFAFVGLNIWCITQPEGGSLNYIIAAICLGSGLYSMFSLVEYPD